MQYRRLTETSWCPKHTALERPMDSSLVHAASCALYCMQKHHVACIVGGTFQPAVMAQYS